MEKPEQIVLETRQNLNRVPVETNNNRTRPTQTVGTCDEKRGQKTIKQIYNTKEIDRK